jgi:hypothetical protein
VFQTAASHGAEKKLEIDESELNGWIGENLVLKRPGYSAQTSRTQESLISLTKKKTYGSRIPDDTSLEQDQSTVRDIKIELLEDTMRLYLLFEIHGVSLSMQIEGPILVQDGYMRMEPIRGKLGSFPLIPGTLRSAAYRLFGSPGNKEKFRVPPQIKDIRIEHGQFVVISS